MCIRGKVVDTVLVPAVLDGMYRIEMPTFHTGLNTGCTSHVPSVLANFGCTS